MTQGAKAGMVFRVRCLCGREAAIDVRSFGRPFICTGCRGHRIPAWGIDSKTKAATPITFEADATPPRGFKLPLGMYELPCPCGQRLFARPKQAGKRVQCPVCSFWLKLEHGRDPQTLETRIRVVKSRLNQLPEVPPAPPPNAPAIVQYILCSCGESLSVEATGSVHQAQCGACGTVIKLEVKPGADSSCIVVDPPAPKGGIDEALSLDDFK
jgi:hypothetical protein